MSALGNLLCFLPAAFTRLFTTPETIMAAIDDLKTAFAAMTADLPCRGRAPHGKWRAKEA